MTNLLTCFDRDKIELGKSIDAAPSLEEAVKLTEGYFSSLHRNMTGEYSLQKSRYAGYLLEILRYTLRTLNSVDKVVHLADFRTSEAGTGFASTRIFIFGKTVQSALILVLLLTLLSIHPSPWIPILLVLILLGTEIYLQVSAWRRSAPNNAFDPPIPDEKPRVDVQLKIAHVHAFLNCISDALSYADKALDEQPAQKEGGFLEKETQILKLFQDLFEARSFHDGDWALKKISHIQAILWEQGIAVKEFDPMDTADAASFDVEPGPDPSISRHVTIRPAFIKGKRVLLRGRVAAPFGLRG